MTLEELARASGLVHASSVHAKQRMREIEVGDGRTHGVKMGTLYALAHTLDCDPSDLLPTVEEAMAAAGITEKTQLAVEE